jgi:ATP-binding cassette subfamily B protein
MGSHQELLGLRGIYWKLYQLQYKDQELGSGAGIVTGLAPELASGLATGD